MEQDKKEDQAKPKILPLPNRPYNLINDIQPKVVENCRILEVISLSTIHGIALCRCRASKNKPFCDGPHKVTNFKNDRN